MRKMPLILTLASPGVCYNNKINRSKDAVTNYKMADRPHYCPARKMPDANCPGLEGKLLQVHRIAPRLQRSRSGVGTKRVSSGVARLTRLGIFSQRRSN